MSWTAPSASRTSRRSSTSASHRPRTSPTLSASPTPRSRCARSSRRLGPSCTRWAAADQCSLDQEVKLYNILITINGQVQTGDYAPTKQHGEMFTDFSKKAADQLLKLQQLESGDLSYGEQAVDGVGMPPVWVAPKKGPAA